MTDQAADNKLNTGLTAEQIREKTQAGQINGEQLVKTKSYSRIIRDNLFTLFNLINVILLACILISGSYKNALFFLVVIWNFLIGTIQEDTVKNCYGITGETKLIIKKANLGGMQAKKDEFEDKELKAAAASSRKGGSGRSGAPRGGMPGGMPNAPEVPPREKKQETVRRETPKVGRNDPCPCGSGKKYKNCCMKKDMGLVPDPFDGDK